jgi:NAD(P)-dependent dehydrogenase (short-subunit alcohol dehydrogenase family)
MSIPVVLITGASSGVGLATAELLAARGCRVFGASRRPERVTARGWEPLTLDVTSPASIAACVRTVLARAGRIDVLVNNAGLIGPGGAVEEIDLAQGRALFETNFFGAAALVQAVLPVMRAQGGGRIVLVTSIGGELGGVPYFAWYIASKHALEGYAEVLRHEVRPFGIHVTTVLPGYLRTAIDDSVAPPAHALDAYAASRARVVALDRRAIQLGRDPRLAALVIARVLAARAPAAHYAAGTDAVLLRLALRLLPFGLVEWFMHWLFLGPGADPQRLGLRRLFIDSLLADRALRAGAAAALLAAAGVLLGLNRRARRGQSN